LRRIDHQIRPAYPCFLRFEVFPHQSRLTRCNGRAHSARHEITAEVVHLRSVQHNGVGVAAPAEVVHRSSCSPVCLPIPLCPKLADDGESSVRFPPARRFRAVERQELVGVLVVLSSHKRRKSVRRQWREQNRGGGSVLGRATSRGTGRGHLKGGARCGDERWIQRPRRIAAVRHRRIGRRCSPTGRFPNSRTSLLMHQHLRRARFCAKPAITMQQQDDPHCRYQGRSYSALACRTLIGSENAIPATKALRLNDEAWWRKVITDVRAFEHHRCAVTCRRHFSGVPPHAFDPERVASPTVTGALL
jgi:hypothetical protein